mgnify:CR=1 FL=1
MADFNPDEYLAGVGKRMGGGGDSTSSTKGFDPDAYLAEKQKARKASPSDLPAFSAYNPPARGRCATAL